MNLYVSIRYFIEPPIAVLLGVILLPVFLVVAFLIKLDSRGPVIFVQLRVGFKGRIFRMYKFRTMKQSQTVGAKFAADNDDRITRIGRFLRRTRIDELPQLWNIINLSMSFIGPRPEQIQFVEEFKKTIPNYMKRHEHKPGITGLAQITSGYAYDDDTTKAKLSCDLDYINRASLKLDLYILIRTLGVIVNGFGAR